VSIGYDDGQEIITTPRARQAVIMLTGNLVRVRTSRSRIIPLYLRRDDPYWLEVAESLLLVFREGVGMTRGEIAAEIEELVGDGIATLAHRGLAKVLEDRAEFEVVADVPPEEVRRKVFTAAAAHRRRLHQQAVEGHRAGFRRDEVLASVAAELGLEPAQVAAALFADLKDENRMLAFSDLSAQRLIDRYNVALAQAVLLRSTLVRAEVRGEKPARYRQLFRWLKFHRLLYRVEGSMAEGYFFQIDGPLSLFSATNKYGLQMALFLPALLLCRDYRLDAELRWGPKREPRSFHLEAADGLVSHYDDAGTYAPPELAAFVERFRQVAPAWEISESTDVIELGRQGVWVPDYRLIHRAAGVEVFLEVLGFWKRSSVERLLSLLPTYGPPRYVLAISERLKVDDEALAELSGPVLRFKEIPNATELAALLDRFLPDGGEQGRLL
jgi:predicted nuclease of restriction endonuclease-like RecB superfamily